MTHGAEASGPECLHETVCVRPSVEGEAITVCGKNAVHLSECGLEPCCIVVVAHGAAVSGFVANKVRRVREDEIDAPLGKHRKGLYAVGVDDGVAQSCHDRFPPFFFKPTGERPSLIALRTWAVAPVRA